MAALVDIENGRRFDLGEVTTIGRDLASQVRIDDPLISPRHAEIRRLEDGAYQLVDLGSRRGTLRGSRRVSTALLADGDELLLGAVRLRFELGAARPDVAPILVADGRRQSMNLSYRPASDIEDVDRLRRDYEKLRAAFELSQALCNVDGLPGLLSAVLETSFRLLAADRGVIVLLNPLTLQPTLQLHTRRDGTEGDVSISTNVLSEVIESRQGLITADTGSDELFKRSESLYAQSVRSAMCVPLICQHELVGLIHLDSHAASGVFTDKDLELFGAIAGQAAVAIKNALLADQVHDVAMQERKRLSRLVRDLPEGVVLLDATRRVAFLNPRAEQLLPLLCDPTAPIERLGALRIDELLARSEGSEIVLPGPPQRVLALRASESAGPDGGETVVLVREVTDEREQHARSAQQQRLALIGQLAGGVAHDFSNLLAVISNFASFAREAAAEPAVREDIAEVERAADRATELVRQLLAFSRRDLVRPRVVLFEQVIAQFEKLLRRSLRADIALEMRLAQDPFRVKIDPSKLEQVLLNLAVNARDAMPSGGKFVIETSRVDLGESEAAAYAVPKGRYVLLSVSDTGTGMDPEVAARVFEPFFTTKEPGKGTGLGLASVYGIVSQAGGSVSVRSRRGEGATFLILLPETHDLLDGEAHSPSLQAGGDATVLVAEDEVAVRELTRRILSDAGYRVLEAANGDSALDVATRHGAKIDLLLTDLVMPGTGGKQLAKRLNERSPGTRVLFMSGYFDESVAADPDGGDFLAKPFTRAQLLARVRASLERTV